MLIHGLKRCPAHAPFTSRSTMTTKHFRCGEVAEWLKALAWKASKL